MADFRTPQMLAKWDWPEYAREYYGGDVQEWAFRKTGACVYEVWQRPHWLPPRVVARCIALTAKEAKRVFCTMAKNSGRTHA